MFKLPKEMRQEFKGLLGVLITEPNRKKVLEAIGDRKYVFCVGDVVTYTLMMMDIKMDMAIVDLITKRGVYEFADEIVEGWERKECSNDIS